MGQELGVRYVLEGSVRKLGGRVRVTGQLIEAASGHHLWADRFEGETADIFELQDQIVTRVVGALAPRLDQAEIDRAKQSAKGELVAYDLYLRGLAHWNRWTKGDNAKALQLFYAAIDKDRDYSTPYGLAASCYLLGKASGWASSFDEKEIASLIDRAADIGVDDPVALCWAGHALAFFFHDVDRALLLIDRALELDENLAVAWQRSGWVRGYAGDPDGAIASLNKAIRLNPLDPRMFLAQSAMAFAHFIAGRDDQAADWAARALRVKPNWPPALRVAMASNAMLGRLDQAARALTLHLQIDPKLTIAKLRILPVAPEVRPAAADHRDAQGRYARLKRDTTPIISTTISSLKRVNASRSRRQQKPAHSSASSIPTSVNHRIATSTSISPRLWPRSIS